MSSSDIFPEFYALNDVADCKELFLGSRVSYQEIRDTTPQIFCILVTLAVSRPFYNWYHSFWILCQPNWLELIATYWYSSILIATTTPVRPRKTKYVHNFLLKPSFKRQNFTDKNWSLAFVETIFSFSSWEFKILLFRIFWFLKQ